MAGKVTEMSTVKQLLRLHESGVSNRQIAKDLSLGTQALGGGKWQSHYIPNPESLQIQCVDGTNPTICNYGVIYTQTLTFTNNSNSDKILEYYIQAPQTHQSGNEFRRSVGVHLPNDQQFLAYNFLAPRTGYNEYTYGWDSYGGDYQNIPSNQSVSRFVKKITVPRNSTTSTVVEYVLGGQSFQAVYHFVKVVASSNYVQSSSPCDNIINIAGSGSSYTQTVTLSGSGHTSWDSNPCYSSPGQEKIYKFTPSTTGTYNLVVTSAIGSNLFN